MNYHNIETDSMLNGDGLRVILWVSGCSLNCKGCQNPQTHNPNSGILFDKEAENELFEALKPDYISGITFSGGHPLEKCNRDTIYRLILKFKANFPNKNIWLYTGYTWEYIMSDYELKNIVSLCDVICDGRFIEELADINYPYAGSTNQALIDIQTSLKNGCKVLYKVV